MDSRGSLDTRNSTDLSPAVNMDPHKSKRYDRQIRIWGVHGQERLESAKICLLNCGPTGSETLKNLVLGGIGSFTIVDGSKVQSHDLGNNYLVNMDALGQSKAQVVAALLQELNESVAGSYIEEDPCTLLQTQRQFFTDFNLVIATQMREQDVIELEEICRPHGVTLLIVRSYGLAGYLRASLGEHQIIESKPDDHVEDLRLTSQWPELEQFASSFDLSTADDILHKHIPYAVLLIKAASTWKERHGGMLPATSKERSAFKELLHEMRRKIELVPVEEENFDEAVKAAFHAWTPARIPSEVKQLLDDELATPTPSSDDFWIQIAALKAFVENEGNGMLPLDGSIPDMHATTDLFLQLQRIYRERADRDVNCVEAHVRSILKSIGRHEGAIKRDTIKHFCKNARNLRVVRYRSLAVEVSPESCRAVMLQQALSNEPTAKDASLYLLLRAVDRFHATHARYPGAHDAELEDDVLRLRNTASALLSELGVSSATISDDLVSEVCRFGASELHVVAAIMGGIAAQEAIKLLTHQFVPLSATFIFNAMACTTSLLDV